MIFAVFDPSPLTLCINSSLFTFIFAVLLPNTVYKQQFIYIYICCFITSFEQAINNVQCPLILHFSIFQDGGRPKSKI